LRAVSSDADIEDLRLAFEELLAQFPPPPEVVVRPANAGGVPSLLITPAAADALQQAGKFIRGTASVSRDATGGPAASTARDRSHQAVARQT
jgi:hypothetical protein